MAGLDDLNAEATERWAKAARYAQGFADNGMGEALRVYYTRYFPAGVILYAIALALITPLLYDGPLNWSLVLQGGAALFGLLAAIAGLIYNARRVKPRAELGRNLSITIGLEVDEQKYLRRVITGKEPPPQDPVRLAVARSVAVQSRKTQTTNLLTVPLHSYGLEGSSGTSPSYGWASQPPSWSPPSSSLANSGRQGDSSLPQHLRQLPDSKLGGRTGSPRTAWTACPAGSCSGPQAYAEDAAPVTTP